MQMRTGQRVALLAMINVAAMDALQCDMTGHCWTFTWSPDRQLSLGMDRSSYCKILFLVHHKVDIFWLLAISIA